MARMALLLLIGFAAPAGAAEPVTAEAAIDNYRSMFTPVPVLDCPKPARPDEIVVCGRPGAKDPNRLPLPADRASEAVPGEGVSAVVAAGSRERCSNVGPNQNCGGGLPILGIVVVAVEVAVKAIKGRD